MASSTLALMLSQSRSSWFRVFYKRNEENPIFKLNFGFPIDVDFLLLFSKGFYLNGLIDGFFDVATDIVNLIDAPHRFIRVGNVDGGHVESRAIEARAFAQLLHNLHHDALPEK